MPLIKGLQNDKEVDRQENFKKCLITLQREAIKPENQDISIYVFPIGIGRSDKIDDVWVKCYLPTIKEFAENMVKRRISTLLCVPPENNTKLPPELAMLCHN